MLAQDLAIDDLMHALKDKDFKAAREWVAKNRDADPHLLYRKIYDTLYDYIQPASIPELVLLLGQYQFQTSQVIDPEIQMAAFTVEVMGSIGFK